MESFFFFFFFFFNVTGLFSVTMRDMSNISHDGPKWIVLDGDIDPMWIESLNTVMDDNKVKTNSMMKVFITLQGMAQVDCLGC